MKDLQSLIKGGSVGAGDTKAPSPPPSMSGNEVAGASAIEGLVKGGGNPMQKRPQPTHAQVLAALHRFNAIRRVLKPILGDPDLGKKTVRPRLFDAAATLIGERMMTLPEVMNAMKDFPNDPQEQKIWLMRADQMQDMAEEKLVEDYRASAGELGEGGWEGLTKDHGYSTDKHGDHLKSLLGHYGKG